MKPEHNYSKIAWKYQRHHQRYVKHAEMRGLPCQECGRSGGEKIDIGLDDGTGPWEECGFCEGTGFVTKWLRGWWLRFKREEKRKRKLDKNASLAQRIYFNIKQGKSI